MSSQHTVRRRVAWSIVSQPPLSTVDDEVSVVCDSPTLDTDDSHCSDIDRPKNTRDTELEVDFEFDDTFDPVTSSDGLQGRQVELIAETAMDQSAFFVTEYNEDVALGSNQPDGEMTDASCCFSDQDDSDKLNFY